MLRTSLRISEGAIGLVRSEKFLSSNAQDFIEEVIGCDFVRFSLCYS